MSHFQRALVAVGIVVASWFVGAAGFGSQAYVPLSGNTADVTGAGSPYGQVSLATVRAEAPGAVVSVRTLVVNGVRRGYLVVAPAHPTGPLPLIVTLHGVNASATQEFQRDQLAGLASAGSAILVYPAGYDESWDVGSEDCCGRAGPAGVDDVAFVTGVVHAVQTAFSVAVGHTYLIGYSNGGKLAYTLVCDEPALFDRFVAVSAGPLATCTNDRQPPIPIMVTMGSADTEVAALSTTGQPAAEVLSTVAGIWTARDGCTATTTVATVEKATITTYPDCRDGTVVQTVSYAGLTHLWPAGSLVGSLVSGAELAWEFFSADPDPGAAA